MVTAKSDISLPRKLLFYAGMLLVVVLVVESGLYALLKVMVDDYSLSSMVEIRNKTISDENQSIVNDPSLPVLHPYVGYVYDPARNDRGLTAHHGGLSISDYGFIGNSPPLHEKNEDTVVVGIFGGSVAFFFSTYGVDALKKQLQSRPEYQGKEIAIVSVALGGYKQPQQLMALTYLLSLGARFDIVISLDGFNEIALPPNENIPHKVAPFYPRNWHWQAKARMSYDTKTLVGRLSILREQRRDSASRFNNGLLRLSNTMNLLWLISDRFAAQEISTEQMALNQSTRQDEVRYERNGPPYSYDDEKALYLDLARYWRDASLQMARLCQANNILYWHFLQPNQYVEGSKTLSAAELEIAFNAASPYRIPVERGYPALISEGIALLDSNVRFHDMTMVFKDLTESLYEDDCCHLNMKGNAVLGNAIGKLMIVDMKKRDQRK